VTEFNDKMSRRGFLKGALRLGLASALAGLSGWLAFRRPAPGPCSYGRMGACSGCRLAPVCDDPRAKRFTTEETAR